VKRHLASFNTLIFLAYQALWISSFVMLMLRLQKKCARDKKLENS